MENVERRTISLRASSEDPHAVGPLLWCSSWLLQRLPGAVADEHRPALVEALARGGVSIEVKPSRPPVVIVREGATVLLVVEAPMRGRRVYA